jgi:hypothetical protein
MRNTILCELSRLERFLWLLNQTEPVHFLVPAQVAGTVTTDAWKKGLSSLQRRHPFLTASIEQGANNAPCFLGNPGIPIPLRVVEGNALQQLEAEVARELAAPFRAGDAWNNSIAETWLRHKHIDGGPNMFPLIGAEYVAWFAGLVGKPGIWLDDARPATERVCGQLHACSGSTRPQWTAQRGEGEGDSLRREPLELLRGRGRDEHID